MFEDDADLLARFAANLPGAAFAYVLRPDGSDAIEFMNEGCTDIWGVSTDDIGHDPGILWQMVDPVDLAEMQSSIQSSAETLAHWESRFRITNARGQHLHILGRGTPKLAQDGSVTWLTFLFDVTRQAETETKLRNVSDHLSLIIDAMPDAAALYDPEEKLILCNGKYRDIHGFSEDDDISDLPFQKVLEHAARTVYCSAAEGRETQWVAENLSEFRTAAGVREIQCDKGFWLRALDRPTRDGGRLSIRIDFSNSKLRQCELELAAITDPLTGLLNRRGLTQNLGVACRELTSNQVLWLLHIDLDKFKTINDAMGHDAGDSVLKKVADRLRHNTGERTIIARVGGDEFVIAIPMAETDGEMLCVAESLREKISRPMSLDDRLCHVGTSIGIAPWRADSSVPIEQCLLDADTALLKGKAFGRNRTVFFSDDMRSEARATATIAAKIKDGLDRDQFVPFFQPQVEMPGGRVCGFEALVRWKNDDGGYLAAGSFIDIANETGLITQIDRTMLTSSLAAVKSLAGSMQNEPRMSLNLSGVQLRSPNVVEQLLDELFVGGVAPQQVTLEILESTLLDERTEEIAANIHRLAKAGFQIDLDDFGTGHTALASLQKFPVHRIKIDKSLVRDIDGDPAKRAITEGIFELCKKLNVSVMAEGVETDAELETLMQMGITQYQGYLFARPMPFDDLITWLEIHDHIAVAGHFARLPVNQSR